LSSYGAIYQFKTFRGLLGLNHGIFQLNLCWITSEDLPVKELRIPCLIDDYNGSMRGGDRANQYRLHYNTQRGHIYKWWQSLFHGFLGIGLTNCLLIHEHLRGSFIGVFGPDSRDHYRFRAQLVEQLWIYGSTEALKPSIDPRKCRFQRQATMAYCKVCLESLFWQPKQKQLKRRFGDDITNQALKRKPIEASRTWYKCEYSDVRLCLRGSVGGSGTALGVVVS
jgi:hypothetical protein